MHPFLMQVKRELTRAIADSGLSYAEVGRRLGLSRNTIPENLRNPGSINFDRLIGILGVIGLEPEEFVTRLDATVEDRLSRIEGRLDLLEQEIPVGRQTA